MISQIIHDQLAAVALDTSTVAALVFAAFLAIYFFVKIKPAIDSNARVRRQVQKMEERDKVTALYKQRNPGQSSPGQKKPFKPYYKKPTGNLKKDKGYQAHLKQNAPVYMASQEKKHKVFRAFSQSIIANPVRTNPVSTSKPMRPNQGSFGKTTQGGDYKARKAINGFLS